MTTNIRGVAAREFPTSQTHYFRTKLDYTMNNRLVNIGYLPNDAIIVRAQIYNRVGFNAGTANNVEVTVNTAGA